MKEQECPGTIEMVTEGALALARTIAGCEFIPGRDMTPVKEALEGRFDFDQNSPTWEDMAVIAQTVRILQRKEQGEDLTRQLVEWLAQQQEVRGHWGNDD